MNTKLKELKIHKYKNGNYEVFILPDGTKIRYNKLDNFTPDFPENIDIKITNKCDMNCPMCHECSTSDGEEADIDKLLKFCETLHPHTELAIGGGDPLSYSNINNLLLKLKEVKVIPNITVNGNHIKRYKDKVVYLQEQCGLKGVGVSLNSGNFDEVIENSKDIQNVVYHVICGMLTDKQIDILIKHKNIKVLILGYKTKGRGKSYIENSDKQKEIKDNIENLRARLNSLIESCCIVSFDNLAIEQLRIQEFAKENHLDYSTLYMGDDGDFTMYVDAVKMEYAVSSTLERRHKLSDGDTVDSIFKVIRMETKNGKNLL